MHSIMFLLLAKGGDQGSFWGIFGGRGRDVALASATVKGTTTSSTREAIRVDLDTKIGRNVAGLDESGSLARKSSSVKANSTSVKKRRTWNTISTNYYMHNNYSYSQLWMHIIISIDLIILLTVTIHNWYFNRIPEKQPLSWIWSNKWIQCKSECLVGFLSNRIHTEGQHHIWNLAIS